MTPQTSPAMVPKNSSTRKPILSLASVRSVSVSTMFIPSSWWVWCGWWGCRGWGCSFWNIWCLAISWAVFKWCPGGVYTSFSLISFSSVSLLIRRPFVLSPSFGPLWMFRLIFWTIPWKTGRTPWERSPKSSNSSNSNVEKALDFSSFFVSVFLLLTKLVTWDRCVAESSVRVGREKVASWKEIQPH